jgi:hypothetical protein
MFFSYLLFAVAWNRHRSHARPPLMAKSAGRI